MISLSMLALLIGVLIFSLAIFILIFKYNKFTRCITIQFLRKMGILLLIIVLCPTINGQELEELPVVDEYVCMAAQEMIPSSPVMLPYISEAADQTSKTINGLIANIWGEQSIVDQKNQDFLGNSATDGVKITNTANVTNPFGQTLYVA